MACLCWAIDNNLTRKVSASDALFIAGSKGLVAGCVNVTLALGLGMVSFVWLTAEQPLAWRLLQLAWFGAANSLQFSAMNTP